MISCGNLCCLLCIQMEIYFTVPYGWTWKSLLWSHICRHGNICCVLTCADMAVCVMSSNAQKWKSVCNTLCTDKKNVVVADAQTRRFMLTWKSVLWSHIKLHYDKYTLKYNLWSTRRRVNIDLTVLMMCHPYSSAEKWNIHLKLLFFPIKHFVHK